MSKELKEIKVFATEKSFTVDAKSTERIQTWAWTSAAAQGENFTWRATQLH